MDFARTPLLPFFLFSLALHLLFLFSWPTLPRQEKTTEQIPVDFLPSPEQKKPEPIQKAREPRTRPSKAPAQVAKKTTPLLEEIGKSPREQSEKENRREEPDYDQYQYAARERNTIVRRPLPTLKELLPPVTWSASGERTSNREGAVRLDTREPKYISYFASIKRAIELVWEYPDLALRHGIQGKLVLEFTISGNGDLEGTRLIRSSGFSVLDQEAMRAVKAASPFHPIPPWIGKTRLDILASFEYHDNRLKYGFVP